LQEREGESTGSYLRPARGDTSAADLDTRARELTKGFNAGNGGWQGGLPVRRGVWLCGDLNEGK